MLTILLHSGVGELACVVTRYFGGVKLGTAGLIRAYQDSVRAVLAELPIRLRMETTTIRVTVTYKYIDVVRHTLLLYEAHIYQEKFAEAACFHITIPIENFTIFCRSLNEQSAGSALIEVIS